MNTWRCSFRKKNSRLVRYLGDLVFLHAAAADARSCSVGLVGTLEIFFVFVRAIEIKIRAIDHFEK